MSEPFPVSVQTEAFTLDTDAYAWALAAPAFDAANAALLAFTVLLAIGVAVRKGPLAGGRVALFAFLVEAVFYGYAYVRARRNAKRKDAFGVARSFEFSEGAITIRMAGRNDWEIPWTRILRVARRGRFTFLYYEKGRFWPVPDRAFRSEDDRRRLLGLLDRRGLWPVRK